MRTRVLLALAAVAAIAAPASASVLTVGGTFANSCYRAAEGRLAVAESFRACDYALTQEPLGLRDRAGTHVNRAILHMLSARDDAALADLAEATRIDPRQPEIYINQAVIAYRRGSVREARDLASRALDLGTIRPAFAHYLRGVANEDLGAIKAAYADLSKASKLAPRWEDPKLELARYQVR